MNKFFKAVSVLWKTSKIFFILTFILSIFSAVPGVLNLLIWKKIIDMISLYLVNNQISWVGVIGCLFIHYLLKMLADVLDRLNSYIKIIFSRKVEKYVTNETIDAIGMMNLKDIEDSEMHNMIQKATEESCSKMMSLLTNLIDVINNATTFIGMSGIIISFNFKIYLIIFASILPMAIYNKKYFNKLYDVYNSRVEKIRFSKELKSMASRSDVFKEIKVFNSLNYIKLKINEIIDDITEQDKRTQKELSVKEIVSRTIENFFMYLLKGSIIVYGIASKNSIGTINMNMDSVTQLQNATANIVFVFISMHEDLLYLSSFTELSEYKQKKEAENKKQESLLIRDFIIETIELVGVWFKYTDDGRYIIKNLNFKFEVGKTYAIVGYNGGGKSTLIKILMGLYVPQKGSILINGIDISQYNVNEYREKLIVVFQDFVKYPFTVKENIAIGNINELDDAQRIQNAAESACATSFINDLPNKYDEKLVRGWENSTDLSIGQWQRIAIARSNMREGQLVIFDEPSAALDARTENKILSEVMGSRVDRIGIVITHRFLNIKKADAILVIKDGVIVNCGKHTELMQKSEVYKELYEAQKEMI